jgi:acyl carrier protein
MACTDSGQNDHSEITKEIKQFILESFLPGEPESSLLDDDLLLESGIIDSAGAMMLVAFLEKNFSIQILDEELFPENFASVKCMVDLIQRKLKHEIIINNGPDDKP